MAQLLRRAVAIGCLALGPPLVAVQGTGPLPTEIAGSVQGEVRLDGSFPVPAPTRIENTTDPAVCGPTHVLEDWVVSGPDRGIQNVVVSLEGVPAHKAPAVSPAHLSLDNRECAFLPHTSVLTAGSTIEVVNSDPVMHTVHFYGPMDVNIALPSKDMRVTRRVDTPGLLIVKCDIHGWMQAFIEVDSHPFHTVTSASGSFRIAGVPPGEYVLHTWHEKLGDRREPVRIRPGEIAAVTMTYPAQPR